MTTKVISWSDDQLMSQGRERTYEVLVEIFEM